MLCGFCVKDEVAKYERVNQCNTDMAAQALQQHVTKLRENPDALAQEYEVGTGVVLK